MTRVRFLRHGIHLGGQTRADPPWRLTMTSNKAQKIAARQRMAQTGEPYSVARRAVSAGDPEPDATEAPGAAGAGPGEVASDSCEFAGGGGGNRLPPNISPK